MDEHRHSAGLADFAYKLGSIQRLPLNQTLLHQSPVMYGMLLFPEADGSLTIDGRSCPLRPQQLFLLCPGSEVRLRPASPGRNEYYSIQFHVLQAGEHGHFVPARLDERDELRPAHFQWILDNVEAMEKQLRSDSDWNRMKANILFQETIAVLLFQATRDSKSELQQAIRRTLDYIEQRYPLPITREQLAELAGLHPDYYTRAFKKQLDRSPMAYLTEIRIHHAKQLLIQSGASFRAIAQSVGFSDEFYFSRKFKAETGYSPKAYVKKLRSSGKIASLNHLTTGHLMALNIEPYAAVINHAFPVTERLSRTIAIGQAAPDLEKLVTARPDLIVTRRNRHADDSPKERILDQIAPTVALHYEDSWRNHLRIVARIVGKEKEADEWLDRYEWKAAVLRKQLGNKLGGQTLLILGVGQGKLCVFGQRNLGSVLYGDLQLSAPAGIADIGHFKEIAPDELAAFEADRILLTCFRHDGSTRTDQAVRRQLRGLFAHPQWRALSAVRKGQTVNWLDSRHLYTSYNALSHDLLLDKMNEWLMPRH